MISCLKETNDYDEWDFLSNKKPMDAMNGSMTHRLRCLVLTSSMSKTRVPRVEPSPFARRVGLKMVVKSLCLSKNCKNTHNTNVILQTIL